MITGPPLAAIGTIGIEIFGPASGTARWSQSLWSDAGTPWNANGWRDVTPQSMTCEVNWGADYPEGVLTSPACGQWTVRTYDPNRILDPSNGGSPYASSLRPGNPVRIMVSGNVVRTGLIDTVHYDIENQTGILRGTDLLQLIARANLPANQTSVPNTLRARAAELVKRVNLDAKISVDIGTKQYVANSSFEAPASTATNRVDHPGAEGYPDAYATMPSGWRANLGTGTFGTSSGRTHTGTRAYNFRGNTGYGVTNDALNMSQPCAASQPHRLSAWYQRENFGTQDVNIYVHFYTSAGAYIGNSGSGRLIFPATLSPDQWNYQQVYVNAPSNAAYFAIQMEAATGSGGSGWIDDMEFTGPLSGFPSNWYGYPDTGFVTSAPSVADAVDGSMVMVHYGSSDSRFVYQQFLDLIVGQTYTLSAYGRLLYGTSNYTIEARDMDAGYAVVASLTWTTAESVAMVKKSASWVAAGRIQLEMKFVTVGGGGEMHLDLVTITGQYTADPPVGLIDTAEGSVLDHIAMAARDAQYAFWLDKDGVMRFRSFGAPIDNGVQLGGLGGIAMETLTTDASLAGIYTSCTVYDTAAPTTAIKKTDPQGTNVFGEIGLLRERPVPNASAWADNLLLDRSGASIQYTPGLLRIQTMAQLLSILNLEMVEIVTVAVDSATPPIHLPARALGVKLNADPIAGWSAEVLSYVPANDWKAGDVPIPPDIPPPINTQQVVRTYNATKDSRAARTSGGSNYGSGTETELPVGAWSGWRNRAFIDFSAIQWTDVQQIVKAELTVRTSTQVNIGFGSSPKVVCKRITGSWSEGTASSPSSGNALVYPGPAVTDTGSVSKAVTRSQSTDVVIDVTAIVKAWAPTAIGGSAQTQRGIAIFSAGEDSTTYTTEFLSREASSGKPVLRVTVKIPA